MSATEDKDDLHMGSSPARITDPRLAFEARKALVWTCVVGAVALAAFMARPLLIVFAGLVLGAGIDGGARLLGRVLKIGRAWRIAIVLVGMAVLLTGFVVYAGATIASEAAALPEIVEEQAGRLLDWAEGKGLAIDPGNLQSMIGQLASGVGTVTRALTGIAGGVAMMLLIMFLGIYFALEPRLYERGVAWMLPESRREDFFITMSQMGRQLRHLLAGRLFGMVVEGIFTWAMLAGYALVNNGVPVPMAVLLGLITGMLAFIPNIGAVVSGVLTVLVGFSGGVEMGLYTIFVYVTVQTIDGNVLVPLIAKRTVDLAPALVLATQLVMGVMFGIIGLAMADPLVAMLKVALERRSQQNDAEAARMKTEELP